MVVESGRCGWPRVPPELRTERPADAELQLDPSPPASVGWGRGWAGADGRQAAAEMLGKKVE